MKIAVIDIGSNSVRLTTWQDGKTLYKDLNTTRLGEGTAKTRALTNNAIERTAQAVKTFKQRAVSEGAEKTYAFATEAVRSAVNGADFCARVKEVCGVEVEVLSGETGAALGCAGALQGRDGVVVDVGGSSSEVIFSVGGKTEFSYSLPTGSVRLFDEAGRSFEKLGKVIDEKISKVSYPEAKDLPVVAIGGMATTVASVYLGLKVYDPEKVHGTKISSEWIGSMAGRICSMPVDEVKAIEGMEPRRADVIGGGALLLYKLVKTLGADSVIISESDNLEGYVALKTTT